MQSEAVNFTSFTANFSAVLTACHQLHPDKIMIGSTEIVSPLWRRLELVAWVRQSWVSCEVQAGARVSLIRIHRCVGYYVLIDQTDR